MTVQELIDVMPECNLIEVVVRKTGHGQWIQGYRIGKEAKIYPAEVKAELRELKGLKEYKSSTIYLEDNEVIDVEKGFHLHLKVICKDCHKLPPHIGNLEVCDVLPRNIPRFHGEYLTHNEFSAEINCYPEGFVPESWIEAKETKKISYDSGQLCLEDYFGKVMEE